jgi:hypothetical protein
MGAGAPGVGDQEVDLRTASRLTVQAPGRCAVAPLNVKTSPADVGQECERAKHRMGPLAADSAKSRSRSPPFGSVAVSPSDAPVGLTPTARTLLGQL